VSKLLAAAALQSSCPGGGRGLAAAGKLTQAPPTPHEVGRASSRNTSVPSERRSVSKAASVTNGVHERGIFASPNQPLTVIPSPRDIAKVPKGAPPRIASKAWRVRVARPRLSRWDVQSLLFFDNEGSKAEPLVENIRARSSGSASDPQWGGLPGSEASKAIANLQGHDRGEGWSGRPDENWDVWLGAEWRRPVALHSLKLDQRCTPDPRSPAAAQAIFIEAVDADGLWGLVAGPVNVNPGSVSTIVLRTGHPMAPKRDEAPPKVTPSARLREHALPGTPAMRLAAATGISMSPVRVRAASVVPALGSSMAKMQAVVAARGSSLVMASAAASRRSLSPVANRGQQAPVSSSQNTAARGAVQVSRNFRPEPRGKEAPVHLFFPSLA